jgi:hypothetical protein
MESLLLPPASQTYVNVHFSFMLPKSHIVSCFCSEEVLACVGHSTEFLTLQVAFPYVKYFSESKVSLSYTRASMEGPH